MAVRVHHEQFSLRKGRFVWPGSVLGESENPFEMPGAELVSELARTGWQAPGFDVDVYTYGSGRNVTRYVQTVAFETSSGRLSLHFGNHQRDGAYGLYRAEFDGKEAAAFYDDRSGSRPKEAVERVLKEVGTAISRLRAIADFPEHDDVTAEGDPAMRKLCNVEPVPVPADFPVLYAYVEREEARRLAHGEPDANPGDEYGLSGNGWRLAALGLAGGRPADPRCFEGYSYASDDPAIKGTHVIHRPREDALPVEVRLKHLNDVYVVDNAAFRHARTEDVEKALKEGRERMTDSEINRWTMATARTLVPYAEYEGGYEEPVYVIGRQTDFDEVRLMKGPVEVRLDGEGVVTTMADETTGIEMELFRGRLRTIPHCRTAVRVADDACGLLGQSRSVSGEVQAILDNNPQPSLESLLARP